MRTEEWRREDEVGKEDERGGMPRRAKGQATVLCSLALAGQI
jgi:hypothetical protein